jgi:hypothetical protein
MTLIDDHQKTLCKRLRKGGADDRLLSAFCEAGYALLDAVAPDGSGTTPCVSDTFYGSKWFIGLIPVSNFLDHLAGKPYPTASTPVYRVRSLKEVQDILSTGRHAPFHANGSICFRGQVSEHKCHRAFPNPFLAGSDGQERLILPSFWRKFRNNWNARFDAETPRTVFQSIHGDFLIYHGIQEWQNLPRLNLKRYGPHTMSDLEDFPDPESREYGRRWRMFKIDGVLNADLPLVEQHYGIDTCGLDVTFDPAVGLFFASHKWTARGEKATYLRVPSDAHTGVLYAFVFRDPPLISTKDMVKCVHAFDHSPPERPVVQRCALPFFHSCNINEAVADIDAVFYVEHGFDFTGIPTAQELFPAEGKDAFYSAAMAVKHQFPVVAPYTQFVEYDFS